MGVLYSEGGKIHCNEYMEIYIPLDYFENKIAINKGASIETLGILYTRTFTNGTEGEIKLFSVPVVIDVMAYEFKYDEIIVNGISIGSASRRVIPLSFKNGRAGRAAPVRPFQFHPITPRSESPWKSCMRLRKY